MVSSDIVLLLCLHLCGWQQNSKQRLLYQSFHRELSMKSYDKHDALVTTRSSQAKQRITRFFRCYTWEVDPGGPVPSGYF